MVVILHFFGPKYLADGFGVFWGFWGFWGGGGYILFHYTGCLHWIWGSNGSGGGWSRGQVFGVFIHTGGKEGGFYSTFPSLLLPSVTLPGGWACVCLCLDRGV